MTGRRARRPGTVLAGASAAQAAVSLVNFGLPAIGPELQDEFGLSLFELGAVLSAGILGSGVVLVGVGSLVDRFGARLTMVLGTTIGSLGLAAAALAGSKTAFFLAVLASGIGSAVAPIAGTGALFRVYAPATRGRALGVRQTAVPLGGAIAAVAFPALYAIGGTELTLGFAATAVAVTGLWFAFVIPSERIVREPGAGGSVRTILRTPGVRTLLAVAACYITVLSALVAYLVPAVRESGHSELTASIAFFAVNIAAMAARIAWGWVADRGGGTRRVRALVEVGVLAAAGGVVFAFALHLGPVAVVLASVVFGLGALGWNALVYVSAGERVDPSLAGRSVAVAATVVFVLSAVVTPVLGALVDALGWDALWVATAGIALLGALLARTLPPAVLLAMTLFVALLGFPLFWLSPGTLLALAGLFVTGLGIGGVYPLGVSAAISAAPGNTDAAAARLAIGGGGAILVAPFVLGALADRVGIGTAFGIVVPMLLAALSLALIAGRRGSQ